ncbi:hypothetical protein MKEN_00543900 [Mycena kentingensis (nom. inval.)]|nr:hypothetical protein MKEN_00543900 [Mycena kentingensis (nom. inval.)]
MDVAMLLWRLIRGLFGAPPQTVPVVVGPTLISLPGDLLGVIFDYLRELETPENVEEPYGHERSPGAPLIPLSMTCRRLRAFARSWIFAEIYNWDRGGNLVWPETLWKVPRTLHIRDHAVRHSQPIAIPQRLWNSLAEMDALQVLTLRISGFQSGARAADIDSATELQNADCLLRHLSEQLQELCISGELISPHFRDIDWPALRVFTVRDKQPTPSVPILHLARRMPRLVELHALYALVSPSEGPYTRFKLGDPDGPLSPDAERLRHLTSFSISNWNVDDPLFAQLPETLEDLHLVDVQARQHLVWSFRTVPYPLIETIERISHLRNLRKLELTSSVQAMPHELWKLAPQFPLLVELSINHSIHFEEWLTWVDEHPNECMEPLRAFQSLKHLRVTVHFTIYIDYRGVPAYGAYRVLEGVPQLERVSFRWAKDPDVLPKWDTWDRSILTNPCPPPRPAYPDIEEEDAG